MIVTLEDSLFTSSPTLQLLSVIRLGFEGWHLIQTDPVFDPAADRAVNRWLARQDESAREEVQLTFEMGLEEAALGIPLERSLRITEDPASDWSANPPCVSLEVALPLLRAPLRVLVENRQNDGAFLQTVAPRPWREKLRQAIQRRWIELEHGGGADMQARLATLTREEALRLWAMFDSDAREPGKPSELSERLCGTCHQQKVPYHRLQRRSIENYLPVKALESWAYTGGRNRRSSRRRIVAAFSHMQPEQRHHYNMKGGFERDRRSPGSKIPPMYDEHLENPDLQHGFGNDIADLFQERTFPLREEWLAKDGQQQEMLDMVQAILRYM